MKLHKAKAKPPTRRQLELLSAVSFGEVYHDMVMVGRNPYIHIFERRDADRPVDVTSTFARMRAQKLVKFACIPEEGRPHDQWARIICLTARGRDIAEDACIALL